MLRWIRSRRALLAELAVAVKERDIAWEKRTNACNRRDAAVKQRDDAWAELAAMQGGLVKDHIRDYRPLSLRVELRREKARADQLAALVDRLQQANMAADTRP